MGVLASLVSQAQPALFGGGVTARATIGATWLWRGSVTDTAGDPIDLTAVTGVCEVVNKETDAVVQALDYDGNADGTFTVGLDETDSALLAAGKYRWRFTLDDATDVVQVWGGPSSNFEIMEA